jgi:uncharacterized protein YndB with AHSA1/START domain
MRRLAGLIGAVVIFATPARGEVVDKAANGFTVKVVLQVAAPPGTVYTSLVRHVGEWWDGEHTYSGDAKNLSIIPEPGGCFCETLPAGGVQHGTVVNVAPGKLLRIVGSLGPLQESGTSGAMTWQIEPSGTGSKLTFTYAVGGYVAGGLEKLAPIVDGVLNHQVQLLKIYSEKVARIP